MPLSTSDLLDVKVELHNRVTVSKMTVFPHFLPKLPHLIHQVTQEKNSQRTLRCMLCKVYIIERKKRVVLGGDFALGWGTI